MPLLIPQYCILTVYHLLQSPMIQFFTDSAILKREVERQSYMRTSYECSTSASDVDHWGPLHVALSGNHEQKTVQLKVVKCLWDHSLMKEKYFLMFQYYEKVKVKSESRSVVSNSLRPQALQPTRLLHPWDFPGKNTGVGCHFLLQEIFPTQGLNPGLLHCRQMLYHLSHPKTCQTTICIICVKQTINNHYDIYFLEENVKNYPPKFC